MDVSANANNYIFTRGKKFFELSNHLGNVLVTISDRKLQITGNGGGESNGSCESGTGEDVLNVTVRNNEPSYIARTEVNLLPGFDSEVGDDYIAYTDATLADCIDYTAPPANTGGWYYGAEVISANDFYPFGLDMPGRKFGAVGRFGFNGKERDKDMNSLTAYDYGFRIYNPAIGRFLSVDPLAAKYPWYTPYSFAGNKPIQCIDLDGAEEAIPYVQSAAFDMIATSSPGVNYVRGKKGDKLATSMPDERGDFEKFLYSIAPIKPMPIEPAPHIAQAINFGNSVGSVVYDYEEGRKGNYGVLMSNTKTVYLKISGYSEVGQAIVENLRCSHGLKELSNAEIADYISSVKLVFEPGKDYSSLFWTQTGGEQTPQILLSRIGPFALPLPAPSIPVLIPPLGGTSAVNTTAGSITVSTDAVSQEIAATLAPNVVQMAHDKKQSQSTGSTKKGSAKANTHEKGEVHGSLSSKKGNKPNPNKRKGAEDRGGKKN